MKSPRPARLTLRFGPAVDPKEADALHRVRAWIAQEMVGTDQECLPSTSEVS
jgi:hypothetical protein